MKRNPVWFWVLIVVVAAIFIWGIFEYNHQLTVVGDTIVDSTKTPADSSWINRERKTQ
jgi:hypothetical protein